MMSDNLRCVLYMGETTQTCFIKVLTRFANWRTSCSEMFCMAATEADQRGTKCSIAFHTFSKRCALNSWNSSTFIFVFQAFVRAGGAGTEDRPSRWRTDQQRHPVSHSLEGWSPRCPVARSFGLSKQCEAYFGIGPGGPARLPCAWSQTRTDSPVHFESLSLSFR